MNILPSPHSEKISLTERKLIKAMARAKVRKETSCFLAEGAKTIAECLLSFPCQLLVMSEEGLCELKHVYSHEGVLPLAEALSNIERRILLPSSYDFSSISQLRSPRPLVALFKLPHVQSEQLEQPQGMTLLLDGVQDPGNVGSIIRTADWFGITSLLISMEGADPFSPKVVQASMGSIAHLALKPLTQEGITAHLHEYKKRGFPIVGTFLEGENIFLPKRPLPTLSTPSLLVLGNEGKGISESVASYCTRRITIPSLSPTCHGESLNVAVATAITLATIANHT
ncbi:RNA methyltransferase, TrmH family [Bacteroidales bacterium KA00251]|nr:RNA methyltransferase, TrmH family [Bacteroidales bacterium KA00251]